MESWWMRKSHKDDTIPDIYVTRCEHDTTKISDEIKTFDINYLWTWEILFGIGSLHRGKVGTTLRGLKEIA